MRTLRIALSQINLTVGDLNGNTNKIIDNIEKARGLKTDLIAFPELAIPGYPPEDLIFKHQFLQDNLSKMNQIVKSSKGITVVVGFVDYVNSNVYNAAAIAHNGNLVDIYHKIHLPNYGVFDELRYFKPGNTIPVYVVNGTAIGINICEDIWYKSGPSSIQSIAGAKLIVNINGSPFHIGKRRVRRNLLKSCATFIKVSVAYVNMVCGQDELVFDGDSMIINETGEIHNQTNQFQEELLVSDIELPTFKKDSENTKTNNNDSVKYINVSKYSPNPPIPLTPKSTPYRHDDLAEIYAALVIGTRDYVRKCGFGKVLIAVSGGIDSSLVAAIAVDALGNANVTGVTMPSRFSSDEGIHDVNTLSKNLGINLRTINIENIFSTFLGSLKPQFSQSDWGVTEENLQSRIRGNIMMALSNKFGELVLTTGNKSEMSTGYATIYGDMAGSFAVIKDVSKTLVYKLSEHRNKSEDTFIIPQNVILKAPSAELSPNQKDSDTLPPYPILDSILEAYVEEDKSFQQIIDMGFNEFTVQQTINLVDQNEYKRRQAPPGIKITQRNFGRDRRMPITNRYKPF